MLTSATSLTIATMAFEETEVATEEELARGMEPVPVERVDRDRAVAYFLALSGGDHPRVRPIIEKGIDEVLCQLDLQPGDELWICKSRYIGPFAGHQGLGAVQDGVIVRYKSLVQY
jgi:hypothetical protein